jgi:hypothetical protein
MYRPAEVEEKEYEEFYKAITKDTQSPLAHIHFVAEGEVTFKSLLYVPTVQPSESFNKYGTRTDNIKVSPLIQIKNARLAATFYFHFSCTSAVSSSLTTSKISCRII